MLGQPLATDVLHHRVLRSLGRLQDVLDQRARAARLQLHGEQVRWAELTAQQVGFDLQRHQRGEEGFMSFSSRTMVKDGGEQNMIRSHYLAVCALGL